MIVVPHVEGQLREQTRQWAWANDARLVTLETSDEAYWIALRKWWRATGDLVIVEQDIVPADGVVAEMLACEHDWCSSPFDIGVGTPWGWGLGCTKFSERLRRRLPGMAVCAGEAYHDREPPGVWWQIDTRLSYRLAGKGWLPHGHPQSRHLRLESS